MTIVLRFSEAEEVLRSTNDHPGIICCSVLPDDTGTLRPTIGVSSTTPADGPEGYVWAKAEDIRSQIDHALTLDEAMTACVDLAAADACAALWSSATSGCAGVGLQTMNSDALRGAADALDELMAVIPIHAKIREAQADADRTRRRRSPGSHRRRGGRG